MIRKRVLVTRRCRSLDMGRYYVAAGGVSTFDNAWLSIYAAFSNQAMLFVSLKRCP